jgi:transcriptional regulator with XRE-family HTH domain
VNKVEEAIKRFRSNRENGRLFLEAQAEVRLSEKMTDLRLQAGLTQRDLAGRLNVSQAYVAKLENGGYDKCGVGTLRGIALALGFEIAFDAMFVPHSHGYAPTSSQSRTVILHASNHSTHPISRKVIDFQAARRDREAAVG